MSAAHEAILADPRFQALAARRRRFSGLLTALTLALYFTFILAVAFKPEWLATPLRPGGVISWGIPLGLAVIVLSFALTGWYAHVANTRFDPVIRALLAAHAEKDSVPRP